MNCCHVIIKYLLFILNLVIAILSLGIIGIGTYAYINVNSLLPDTEELDIDISGFISFVSIPVIAVGCFIFIVSFLGCCGSVTESKCLLITFATFMFLLAAAKVYPAIYLFQNDENFKNEAKSYVENLFSTDLNEGHLSHVIEYTLECCGPYGPDYYKEYLPYAPPTCCENFSPENIDINDISLETIQNSNATCLVEDAFEEGCANIVGLFVYNILFILERIIIVMIVVEIVEMIAASYLSCSISHRMRYKRY